MKIDSRLFRAAFVAAALASAAVPAVAQQAAASGAGGIDAEALFNQRCSGCHSNGVGGAPNREGLVAMPVAHIVDALTNGKMAGMASGLTAEQVLALGVYLGAKQADAAAGSTTTTTVTTTTRSAAPASETPVEAK